MNTETSTEIFSYHLLHIPLLEVPRFLYLNDYRRQAAGLRHAECFFTMNLGEPILAPSRFNFRSVALFAWWDKESFLDDFLSKPEQRHFQKDSWHIRMKLYRTWGEIQELRTATVRPELAQPQQPVVAVTLARLKLSQTARFAKWGKPVETQVRRHPGKRHAWASMRPLNTFSTFSIWQSEADMLNMVRGKHEVQDGESHKLAMKERIRRDFHHEFMTMRFAPIAESGEL
jgi:hypothetical protein